MNKDIAEKWVSALRSGEYAQGVSALCMFNKHCCLGVLCEVYKKETGDGQWTEATGTPDSHPYALMFTTIKGDDTQLPPKAVYNWAGMNDSNPVVRYGGLLTHFTALNDKSLLTFDEIAEIIEKSYESL